jgi:hypothetical protein
MTAMTVMTAMMATSLRVCLFVLDPVQLYRHSLPSSSFFLYELKSVLYVVFFKCITPTTGLSISCKIFCNLLAVFAY